MIYKVIRKLTASTFKFFLFKKSFQRVVVFHDEKQTKNSKKLDNLFEFYLPKISLVCLNYRFIGVVLYLLKFELVTSFGKLNKFEKSFLCLFPNFYQLDPDLFISGWEWHRLINDFESGFNRNTNSKLEPLIEHLDKLRKHRNTSNVNIFGTGPSLGVFNYDNLPKGINIACNTIVRDKDLFQKIDPDIFVCGDAVYHFSHSAFSLNFRNDLKERLISSKALFIYPSEFHNFILREFGDLEERLFPIPIGRRKDVFTLFSGVYELPALGNVLLLLLLPLALISGRHINMLGFDGSNPNRDRKKNPFWENSSKHSYNEFLPQLKKDFPYFFNYFVPSNNSKSYVDAVHGDQLETQLQRIESEGFIIKSLNPSFTSAISKRFRNSS